MSQKINGKDLRAIGFPETAALGIALQLGNGRHFKFHSKDEVLEELKAILANPVLFKDAEPFIALCSKLIPPKEAATIKLEEVKPYDAWGKENIEKGAIDQMNTAMSLPVTVAGALMPDAHAGYGLPIGGVLATDNAVIPFGVGVDIGCRMCLTIYDLPSSYIERNKMFLQKALQENTKFGMKETHLKVNDHEIFEREEFNDIAIVKSLKDRAFRQLGSSGGGNHFVEFGIVDITDPQNEFGIACGEYVAILSHSGSRGMGANIAKHYTDIAMKMTVLPKEAKHLAWLDLNTQEGMEYWLAMNLAGDYASACHHDIHKRLAKAIGAKALCMVENHHNFAWKEKWDGKDVIVHRKGATPAGEGVLGIIPGSMTAPGFIVRGKGVENSINSASHGAGRAMSRTQANNTFSNSAVKKLLKDEGVMLIGGGTDEAPGAYKDINQVMKAQTDLVDVIGKFQPKIVRMADDGEPE